MTPDLLAAALRYADRGWPVLPCHPGGKAPLPPLWTRDATTDTGRIRGWWARWPNANVAIATGSRSGVVVVDVDSPEGELALVQFGAAVPTLTHKTPKGRHLFFQHAPGIGYRLRLRSGLDVLGEAGLAVCPPSRDKRGWCYGWENDMEPVPLPDLLHRALLEPSLVVLQGDARRDGLAKLAARAAVGARYPGHVLQVVHVVNCAHCRPPLPEPEVDAVSLHAWERRTVFAMSAARG